MMGRATPHMTKYLCMSFSTLLPSSHGHVASLCAQRCRPGHNPSLHNHTTALAPSPYDHTSALVSPVLLSPHFALPSPNLANPQTRRCRCFPSSRHRHMPVSAPPRRLARADVPLGQIGPRPRVGPPTGLRGPNETSIFFCSCTPLDGISRTSPTG
jgi:hypothetical protein